MSEFHSSENYKSYTISQAAKKLEVPVHRLRYFVETAHYDVERDEMGNRRFSETDIINIRKFMKMKKKVTYEAIGEHIIKGNPIDEELEEDESFLESDSVENYSRGHYSEENNDEVALSLSQHQSMEAIKTIAVAIQKFQDTLDTVNRKLEKIDKIDELSSKLDNLEKLEALNELSDIKNEMILYMSESKEMFNNANREMEQRVVNMTMDLKESMNKQRESIEKEKNKSFFQKLFGK